MPLPPRYVLYTSVPAGASLATNASCQPWFVDCAAPRTGKSADAVTPATYALPCASSAIPCPASVAPTLPPLPPRYVLNSSDAPLAASRATKASWPPASLFCQALATGKFHDQVDPVTYAVPPASTAIPAA